MRRGEIHVWFCDFSAIADFGEGTRVLGEAEVQRAARFRSEDARFTFVGSHIFLRQVLGSYLQLSGGLVAFAAEATGKPRLDGAVHSTGLEFNLSRSHGSAICVVAHSVAVGIDMERPDPKLCELATAEQVFSMQELRRLQELEPREGIAAFFRGWTKKEAYAKCKGLGLAADLKSVELGLGRGSSKFENVSLSTFECPGSYIASLAIEGAINNLRFWKLGAASLAIW
jgi:4'-phosphopantetheinyl transferase